MSGNKYANLPDIDTAPDIYETEDVSHIDKEDSSDDEAGPARGFTRRNGESAGKEELDSTHLISVDDASRKFRKAEQRRERMRSRFAYPPSPTSDSEPLEPSTPASRTLPLSYRVRNLQAELAALEAELADPTNSLLADEEGVDAGTLIKDVLGVKGRLARVSKAKESRARLVGAVISDAPVASLVADEPVKEKPVATPPPAVPMEEMSEARRVVEMDKRVGELEKLVGSSGASLDESAPLPPPLLPLISKLNTQLTLLTQPRHIDSISRRLKLLLADLERTSTTQHSHRRHGSQSNGKDKDSTTATTQASTPEVLLPLLTRLVPTLPHIPHILTRLRTLSALHASASTFQQTLGGLEKEQRRVRDELSHLSEAVETVEGSLEENRTVVKGNVGGLEERMDSLFKRLDGLSR